MQAVPFSEFQGQTYEIKYDRNQDRTLPSVTYVFPTPTTEFSRLLNLLSRERTITRRVRADKPYTRVTVLQPTKWVPYMVADSGGKILKTMQQMYQDHELHPWVWLDDPEVVLALISLQTS
jgi:hypothetical protein